MHDVDFQRVFDQAPGLFLVLLPDTGFTVVAASEAYLSVAQVQRTDIIGSSLFDIFPDEPTADSSGTLHTLRRSLEQVVATGSPHTMPVQRYDLPILGQDGELGERYWTPLNVPVFKSDGTLLYIIHRVEDATELMLAQRQEHDEHAQLIEANNRFQAIYDQGLYAGRLDLDGRVIDVNRSCLETCGFKREEVIGKHFWDCGWWNHSPQIQEGLKAAVHRAARGEASSGESTYFWSDGSEHVVDFACIPIKDKVDKVMFLVGRAWTSLTGLRPLIIYAPLRFSKPSLKDSSHWTGNGASAMSIMRHCRYWIAGLGNSSAPCCGTTTQG